MCIYELGARKVITTTITTDHLENLAFDKNDKWLIANSAQTVFPPKSAYVVDLSPSNSNPNLKPGVSPKSVQTPKKEQHMVSKFPGTIFRHKLEFAFTRKRIYLMSLK